MTDYLRIVYWVLTLTLAIVFFLGCASHRVESHNRIVGLIIIGFEALVWVRLSKRGRGMI